MSYLLKFQTSSGVVVEYILKNTKHGRATCYSCRHCLLCRSYFQQNAHQFSTYLSELKLLSIKKKVSKIKENDSTDAVTVDEEKISKMLKLNTRKPLKKSSTLSLKNNSSVDTTKSYDPNFFHNSLKVETFFDNFVLNNNITQSAKANKVQELNQPSHKQVECAVPDVSFPKIQKQFKNSSQKNEIAVQKNFFKLLTVNKTSPKQSLKKSVQVSAPCIEEKKEMVVANHSQVLPEADIKKIFTPDEIKEQPADSEKVSAHLDYHESFLDYVRSYLDICITNDKVLEGFGLIQNIRKKNLWKFFVKQKNKNLIRAYNALLNSLADKGYWFLLTKVVQWMKCDNVKLNSRSFAAILCCLGKVNNYKNEKFMEEEIPKVIKQLFANNISLDDLFSEGNLTKENTEKVLSVIREVVPFFNIKPVTINLNSDCPLTKNLYKANTNLKSPMEDLGMDCLENLVEEQMLIEKKFYIKVKAVSRGCSENASNKKKSKLEDLKRQWRYSITKAVLKIKREMLSNQNYSYLFDCKVHFNSVPTESIIDILLNFSEFLFNYSGGFSPSSAQIRTMLGSRVSECYQLRKKDVTGVIDATENLFKKYVAWYLDPKGPAQNSRQSWQMLIQDSDGGCRMDTSKIRWPKEVINKLGQCLFDIIIKEVKFTIEKSDRTTTYPVFYTVLRYHENTWREEIKCHPYVGSLLDAIGFDILSFRADEMPMVCPPKPWKSTHHGGYLILSTDFIRKPQNIAGKVIKFNEIPLQRLYPTFDSLNALQSIPWTINEEVLDIILEIFKNGGSKELQVPHFPTIEPVEFLPTSGMSHEERMKAVFKRKKIIQKRNDDYGIWCDALYRLSLANHYRKRIFWLPQNCDFRGRVYPVPPLLNHIGSDLFRSLLLFAKGKPLGPKGLDWMKIHLINLAGSHKKKSIEERLAYANEILPVILDSAEKPLTGFKWWTKAEEPWQTLAACIEIKKILSSPDPEQYSCSFPIHQDGSCNGLQHYAALGKDLVGAQSVNLASFKTPQDVYSVVAELVEKERKKDAAAGKEIAVVLNNFIDRKIVKQTVMTTVYGVTHYGAKIQIRKRLEEIPNFPEEYISPASCYLADKVFLCLKQMFTSAKNIQDWFIRCADVICSMNEYVEWTSPLGLPVLQSYGNYRNCHKLKKIIVPNKVKQKNAFPPNFIHSLDSCHMMLTSLYCEQAGLTFAAVHDCFWTHPSNVDTMNKICREQFISLHSQSILEDLSQSFKKQYFENRSASNKKAADIFEAIPKKGNFDVNEIINSVYFFS